MRARDIVELRGEAVHLAFLEKPTRKQAKRLREIAEQVDGEKWFPSRRTPTGGKPDILGINWRARLSGGHSTTREVRRSMRFEHVMEKSKRSRRQRRTRRRRTGGAK